MFGLMFCRSIHFTKARMSAPKTSVLAKLRKSTGYPLSNCKKALELFPDDLTKAEEWLNAEAKSKGWSKWAKIQGRSATQGLIGVCSRNNIGVMLEVNCETDFVSRNAEFQQIVEKMLSACMNHAASLKLENDITKASLNESELNSIHCETSALGELIVAATMKFNEKTVAKRAVFLKVPDGVLLNSLTHPAVVCPNLNGATIGKYGVLLASKLEETENQFLLQSEDVSALRINLCHHIIGMNPLSVGQLTEKDILKFSEKPVEESSSSENLQSGMSAESTECEIKTGNVKADQTSEPVETDSEDSQDEIQESVGSEIKESSETELVFQSYLMDSTVTVGETLFRSGIEVLSFERFECGETSEESLKVSVEASA